MSSSQHAAPGSTSSPPAFLRWLAGELPAGRLLNLGSGQTSPDSPGRNFVGVDLSPPPAEESAGFVLGDASALPFADGSFDGALLKDILEHVPDPIRVLRGVARVCRPGATAVVTVPRAIPRAVWSDPTHIRGFTASAIVDALTCGGWEANSAPRRIGGLPFAGRLGIEHRLVDLMRVPGLGHYFGTNWFVIATRTRD